MNSIYTMNYKICLLLLFTAILLSSFTIPSIAQTEIPDPRRFSDQIQDFSRWDLKNSFPEDAILFVGSSSIRLWETAAAFPRLPVINRGFGGSIIPDVDFYYEQTVAKYDPQMIVFYTGDNDIALGMPEAEVIKNYKRITDRILSDLPEVKFIYLPIKPSSSRWGLWEKMSEVNRKVEEYNRQDDRLFYVDLATPLLSPEGRPDDSLFREDRLHLNQNGYAVWIQILGPVLNRLWQP